MEDLNLSFSSKLSVFEASEFLTSKNETHYVGCGGFAHVRICEHRKLGKVVAKCFAITGTKDDIKKRLNDVKREADVLVRMTHHHIVKIYGITNWNDNIVAIILDYINCGNLEGLLESSEEISWDHRRLIAWQINSALKYLHNHPDGKSFYHGDIKPVNVLLDKHLNVKLADFGSVNVVTASGWESTTLDFEATTQHTLCYSAPEVIEGENIGPPADVYSVGMILYELTTRTKAYSGTKPLIIGAKILGGIKPNLAKVEEVKASLTSDRDQNIVSLMLQLMKRCWDGNPTERPTAIEVEKSLESVNENDSRLEREKRAISTKLRRPYKTADQLTSLSSFVTSFREAPNSPTVTMEETYPKHFLQVGSYEPEQDCTKCDVTSYIITKMPKLNVKRIASTSVKIGDCVFTCGGLGRGIGSIASCEVLNLITGGSWKFVAPMPQDRFDPASAVIKGSILVSGGLDAGLDHQSTCFLYDVTRNSWSKSRDMNTVRSNHAIAALDDVVYSIGGSDNNSDLSSCEKYQDDRWFEVPSMNNERSSLAAVAFDGCIYALGGFPNTETVERYDPRTSNWSKVGSMNIERYCHGACVLQGKIYAVAGLNEKSVEVYDPRADRWTHCFDTQVVRNYCNVVAV